MKIAKYLNTDLVLQTKVDPALLVQALNRHGVFALYPPQLGDENIWHATFEVDQQFLTPAETIQAILKALREVYRDEDANTLWRYALKRELNIGYDPGDEPWNLSHELPEDMIREIAGFRMSLGFTLYAYREKDEEVQ